MPQTGHRDVLFLADGASYTTLNAIEVQTNLSVSGTADTITASHKDSDLAVNLPGTITKVIDCETRFELSSSTDPRTLETQLAAMETAFDNATLVYLEHRTRPDNAASLVTADRIKRYAGRVSQFSTTHPDGDVANVSMQIQVESEPAL